MAWTVKITNVSVLQPNGNTLLSFSYDDGAGHVFNDVDVPSSTWSAQSVNDYLYARVQQLTVGLTNLVAINAVKSALANGPVTLSTPTPPSPTIAAKQALYAAVSDLQLAMTLVSAGMAANDSLVVAAKNAALAAANTYKAAAGLT